MEAFVSGQAARVVFVEGVNVSYIEADCPEKVVSIPHTDVCEVLGYASDVERMVVQKHEEVYGKLLEKYNFDRCFRMLDIALSDDEEMDTRVLAAEVFSEIAEDKNTYERVRNYTLSCFNDDLKDFAVRSYEFEGNKFFQNFVSELIDSQIHILSFQEALDKSLAENRTDEVVSAKFKFRAIDTGLFKKFVEAKRCGGKIENAALSGYMSLHDVPSSRSILQGWVKQFLAQKSKRSLRQLEADLENYSNSSFEPKEQDERNRYQAYLNIQNQQNAIVEKMKIGEHANARRFTVQMVKSQLSNGDTEYAAKSLTKLATEARHLGLQSIELEWAKWATELAPEDGVAMGMLADTYLNLYRFPDAQRAFQTAVGLGEPEFGSLGLARMQRIGGDPVGALEAIKSIMSALPQHSPHGIHVWQGYCSTLKDLYRFEEAHVAIEKACEDYPGEVSLMCIRANALSDLGRFEEALQAYEGIVSRYPNECSPRCGKAWVLRKIGQLPSALAEFSDVVKRFPNDVNGLIGKATVLRDTGEYSDALETFNFAAKKFSHSPAVFCGIAETYREMGDLSGALRSYEEAVRRFDLDIVARNGRANILKAMGRFEDALQEYDKNVKDFPYNLYALSGRADLLRRLGEYDEAVKAYDTIIRRHPDNGHAKISKSAILVAQGDFEKAINLLPSGAPKTEDEWVGFHIRGMAALLQGETENAVRIFQQGISDAPFYRKRQYFQSALAAALVRMRDFSAASKLLSKSKDPISNLLLVHSLSELGRSDEASEVLKSVDASVRGAVGELRIELGARYKLTMGNCKHDEEWIFQQESEALLQAA